MTDAVRTYRGYDADNLRWAAIEPRAGDIVVSTPSKHGTTWTQLLCALLVWDGDLPGPLGDLSPWVDMETEPIGALAARLAAQDHRRILKTHTPLDGLPTHPGVTYVCVARDPRDAAVSTAFHRANMDRARLAELLAGGRGEEGPSPSPSPSPSGPARDEPAVPDEHDRLAEWIAADTPVDSADEHLDATVRMLALAWSRRHDPDVHLVHFADLVADLPGEVARLAEALAIDLRPGRAEDLAARATLDAARSRAVDVAPLGPQGLWHDPVAFFRAGRVGEWQEVFTPDLAAAYDARLVELDLDPTFVAWLHAGRQV